MNKDPNAPSTTENEASPSRGSTIKSLEKALGVLELMIDEGRDLSITEISQRMSLGKGTVHRILATLKEHRFVQQDANTRMYGFGVRILQIGTAGKREKFLRKAMAPFLRELRVICNETVNAAVWEYNEIRYIFRIESEEMLRIATTSGQRFPAHCCATGKIFLSYLTDEDIIRIYGGKKTLKQLTPQSIGTVDDLLTQIATVRTTRIAYDDEEALSAVFCVAAPILSNKQECIAAISISSPKHRMNPERIEAFARLVAETAAQITRTMTEE